MNRFHQMAARGGYLPPLKKVVLYPLVVSADIRTPGGGTTFTNIEFDVPEEIKAILVHCESMRAHVRVRGKSANFGFITRFYWSLDEAEWSAALDLHPEVTSEGMSITTAYNTTANFGIRSRWAVGVRATAGTASEGATLTIVLEFTFRT